MDSGGDGGGHSDGGHSGHDSGHHGDHGQQPHQPNTDFPPVCYPIDPDDVSKGNRRAPRPAKPQPANRAAGVIIAGAAVVLGAFLLLGGRNKTEMEQHLGPEADTAALQR